MSHPGGRPAKFETDEDLITAITSYFAEHDTNPTITGLAYHLGFESRQSFYDYEKNDQFSYTIKRARLFIESFYEENLLGKGVTGAIFALKNLGWSDKQEVGYTDKDGNDINPTPISFTKGNNG